jgi:hypothetical protein
MNYGSVYSFSCEAPFSREKEVGGLWVLSLNSLSPDGEGAGGMWGNNLNHKESRTVWSQ